MTGLEGRVAVVTGAGRGIGRGIALRLAKEGARVVVASRSEETVERVTQEIRALEKTATGVTVDVGDREQVERMVAQAEEAFGPVEILVNNAQSWGRPGRGDLFPPTTAIEDFLEEDWDYTYQTGLKGSLYGMRAVFPAMRDRGWGRIINFGSPMAQRCAPGLSAYNCAKEAIRALTRTAAQEWGKYGITVNCISPAVLTDAMTASLAAASGGDVETEAQMLQGITQQIPLGRLGDAEKDAGGLAAYIASDDAAYVTGMTFMLDGGATPRP